MHHEDMGNYQAIVPDNRTDIQRLTTAISSVSPRSMEPSNGASVGVGLPLPENLTNLARVGLNYLAAQTGEFVPMLTDASTDEELELAAEKADDYIQSLTGVPE